MEKGKKRKKRKKRKKKNLQDFSILLELKQRYVNFGLTCSNPFNRLFEQNGPLVSFTRFSVRGTWAGPIDFLYEEHGPGLFNSISCRANGTCPSSEMGRRVKGPEYKYNEKSALQLVSYLWMDLIHFDLLLASCDCDFNLIYSNQVHRIRSI